jgi:hypothetical protein
MELQVFSVAITTVGAGGNATGSGEVKIPIVGHIEWVYLDYHASAPATTHVTISYPATPPGGNVLAVIDTATDVLLFPRAKCVDNANAAITNSFTKFPVAGHLSVAVINSDALTACVTVYIAVMKE